MVGWCSIESADGYVFLQEIDFHQKTSNLKPPPHEGTPHSRLQIPRPSSAPPRPHSNQQHQPQYQKTTDSKPNENQRSISRTGTPRRNSLTPRSRVHIANPTRPRSATEDHIRRGQISPRSQMAAVAEGDRVVVTTTFRADDGTLLKKGMAGVIKVASAKINRWRIKFDKGRMCTVLGDKFEKFELESTWLEKEASDDNGAIQTSAQTKSQGLRSIHETRPETPVGGALVTSDNPMGDNSPSSL